MRLKSPQCTFVALYFFLPLSAAAQPSQKAPIMAPHHSPDTPQGAEGGFWKIESNYDPILRLKNLLITQPLDVTPSLFFADGTEYKLPIVHLEEAGVAQIDIRIALASVPAQLTSHVSSYGMAGVSYKWSWSAVIATIQSTDEIASLSLSSTLNADATKVHTSPEAANAQVIYGSWWLPTANADGFLVLANPSLSQKHLQVSFHDRLGAVLATQPETLAPHETTVLRFSSILAAVRGAEVSGGIEVRYAGPDHGVVAYAGIEDEAVGYSLSPALFEDHRDLSQPSHPVTISAPGIMLGAPDTSMLFPSGTIFSPYALLHNVSAKPMTVSLALATEDASAAKTMPIGQVTLEPGQVSPLDFTSVFTTTNALPNGYGHLTASFEGQDGSLLLEAGSVDQSQSYVFSVSSSAQAETASRTLCFWSVEGDTSTMIDVWNYTDAAQDLVLTLYFSGGHYRVPIHLEAHRSFNLDMMTLIRSRVQDPNGNLIPANISSGSAVLSGPKGDQDKMSVAVSTAVYNVRNATCTNGCTSCNGVTELYFNPSSYATGVSRSVQSSLTMTYNTGSTYPVSGGTFSISNTAIASVNSTGLITGVSPGSTYGNFASGSLPEPGVECYSGNPAPCQSGSYGAQAPSNTTPMVTFGPLQAVTVGKSVPVKVSFSSGTTSSVPITLTISMPSGTGSATFSTGGTTTTITTAPTTVYINGVTASSTPNNLLLDATISIGDGGGTQEAATNPQQFSVVSVPIPVNFTPDGNGTPDSSGNLSFSYKWYSSTGSVSDLSNCWVMENVLYSGGGNPFQWPSPPYAPKNTSPNPTRNDGINGDPPMKQGSAGSIPDQQLHPNFQGPYSNNTNTVSSTQTFLWECSNFNNGTFTAFPGISYSITRIVQTDGNGGWKYTVTKSGVSATVDPLP